MKKILLTSSSTAFLKRNVTLLTDKGFQLFTAINGSEALRLHQENNFDLILSDLDLEDTDGCTLCADIHKIAPSSAVSVVIICFNTLESMEKVKQSDADAILLRPVDPTQLLVTIGSFIDMQLARSKRIKFTVDVSGRKKDKEFSCHSHDISSTGILIGTDFELAPGDRISITFRTSDSVQIKTEGKVVRSIIAPHGKIFYGVKFIDLPEANRDAIKKFISENNHVCVMQQPSHPLK